MLLQIPEHVSDDRRHILETAARRLDEQFGGDLLGFVLSGSAGRGIDTEHSDLDLLVIMTPEVVTGPSAPWFHSPELEQIPLTLAHLRQIASFGHGDYAYRWSYAWAPVLADRTGGQIAAAIDRHTHLTVDESLNILIGHERLGAWLNLTFRALKSDRAGQPLQARLDAVEALPIFLDIVFALDGLVRPYNKYLPWALDQHPLPSWGRGELLSLVERMLQGSPDGLRLGVRHVHERAMEFAIAQDDPAIRAAFDEWRPDDYGVVLGLGPVR